jgi:SAM-dependent methyltransferase
MTSSSIDPEAFKAFELAAWGDRSVVAAYSSGFLGLTSQAIQALLDAVNVEPGQWLADIACGPGVVAGVAAERGVRTVGVDFSAEMIAIARILHPGLRFEVGDAEGLDFPDGSFDAAVLNFGLLHLARPESALSEAVRVLRAGGRLAFTVWAPPEEAAGFKIVLDAVAKYGNPNVPLPAGPPFFRFSDAQECARSLESAGIRDPVVSSLALVWHLPCVEALLAAYEEGTARSRGLLLGQTPEELSAVRDGIREGARAYTTGNGALAIPMAAVLASGEKK